MGNFNIPRLTAPELFLSGEDLEVFREVWWEVSLNKISVEHLKFLLKIARLNCFIMLIQTNCQSIPCQVLRLGRAVCVKCMNKYHSKV